MNRSRRQHQQDIRYLLVDSLTAAWIFLVPFLVLAINHAERWTTLGGLACAAWVLGSLVLLAREDFLGPRVVE